MLDNDYSKMITRLLQDFNDKNVSENLLHDGMKTLMVFHFYYINLQSSNILLINLKYNNNKMIFQINPPARDLNIFMLDNDYSKMITRLLQNFNHKNV